MSNLAIECRGVSLQIQQLVIQVDEFCTLRITLPCGKDTGFQHVMVSLEQPMSVDS